MKRFRMVLIVMVMLVTLAAGQVQAAGDMNYTLDNHNNRTPIPLTYDVDHVIINLGEEVGPLNKAEDLFIDKKGSLYVVDTGNNRVLKMDRQGVVSGVYTGPEDKPFSNPKGIYVDQDGDMYVADTDNARVVHLDPDGKYIEEFVKPESSLIDSNYPFKPTKVYIDATGYIYILNESDYHGFITIDSYNRFRGYVAPTRLQFNLSQMLIRSFATQEQKDQIAKELPPSHSNFVIADDGMIYATTVMVNRNQIKKLNSVGNNIYMFKHGANSFTFFGERLDDGGNPIDPTFADLAVDNNGIISALEGEGRKVYQYDAEGNLLTVFGGLGSWKGRFQSPSSIVVDQDGYLYVLDRDLNNIQVFKPTRFISLIHQALRSYYDGKYSEAVVPWQEVLKIDPNYSLAHRGIAKALMKEEKWKEAMAEYKAGEDQAGYSAAFSEYRHQLFRTYFGWIVLAIVLIIAALYFGITYLKKNADRLLNEMIIWKGGV